MQIKAKNSFTNETVYIIKIFPHSNSLFSTALCINANGEFQTIYLGSLRVIDETLKF